jgi:hypothetical protein
LNGIAPPGQLTRYAANLTMQYQVVYDIQQINYPGWWIFGVGLVFASSGTVFFFLRDTAFINSLFDMGGPVRRVIIPLFAVFFGLLWLLIGCLNYAHFASLRKLAGSENIDVVEGTVTQFVPMPYEGHANETFIVNGHRFAYSEYDETTGFHHTQSHGGPIREGLYVRVTYSGNDIFKLEIAR